MDLRSIFVILWAHDPNCLNAWLGALVIMLKYGYKAKLRYPWVCVYLKLLFFCVFFFFFFLLFFVAIGTKDAVTMGFFLFFFFFFFFFIQAYVCMQDERFQGRLGCSVHISYFAEDWVLFKCLTAH